MTGPKPKPRTTLRANARSHTLILARPEGARPVALDIDLDDLGLDADDMFDALCAKAVRRDPRWLDLLPEPVPHPDDDAHDVETYLRFLSAT